MIMMIMMTAMADYYDFCFLKKNKFPEAYARIMRQCPSSEMPCGTSSVQYIQSSDAPAVPPWFSEAVIINTAYCVLPVHRQVRLRRTRVQGSELTVFTSEKSRPSRFVLVYRAFQGMYHFKVQRQCPFQVPLLASQIPKSSVVDKHPRELNQSMWS